MPPTATSRAVDTLAPERQAAFTRPRHGAFYFAMGLVAVAIVLAGFGPALFQDSASRRGVATPLIRVHGAVSSLWLLLYLGQTFLVRRRQTRLHRRLGWIAIPLTVLVVGLGYAALIDMGRRGFSVWWHPDVRSDVLTELVHPFFDLLSFATLVAAALCWRHRSDVHKRLKMLATIGSMMAAPLAHLLGYAAATRAVPPLIVPLLGSLYFSSAVYDRLAHGRIHPVSLWGGLSLFALANVRAVIIGPSEAWHQFASWLIQ